MRLIEYRGLRIAFEDETPDEVIMRAIEEAFGPADAAATAQGTADAALELAGSSDKRTTGALEMAGRLNNLVDELEARIGAVDAMTECIQQRADAALWRVSALDVEAGADRSWRSIAGAMRAALDRGLDIGDEVRSLLYDRAATAYRARGVEPPARDRAYTADELDAIGSSPGPDEDVADQEFREWTRKAVRDLRGKVTKIQRLAKAHAED